MGTLTGKVALVTGGSRGIGKGIAVGLGEAGAAVYVTGRTASDTNRTVPLSGTIHETADEVTRLGGKGIAVQCDHSDDAQVQSLFRQIQEEQGRLDLLVNNAWTGYEGLHDGSDFPTDRPFWEKRLSLWDSNHTVGVRSVYIASAMAAPLMVAQKSGLIVNLSNAITGFGNPAYSVAKLAVDRMTADMAHELRAHGVAAVCLYPPLVRTEGVMKYADYFDLSQSVSPQFIGRAVVALATDSNIMSKTGQALAISDLANEYHFIDIDGKQPTT